MRRLQSGIALVCVLLLVAPLASAQYVDQDSNSGPLGALSRPFEPRRVAPVNLSNSNRLESLMRAGNIYLSLQDAIALALENNLDIEIQRYGRPQSEANLLRAKAGGLLRGVPSNVSTNTTSALASLTGNAFGSAGSSSLSNSGGTSGGSIITQTGTAIPTLDPSFYIVGSWAHATQPQSNSLTTGTNTLIARQDSYAAGFTQSFLTGTNVNLGWSANTLTSNATQGVAFNPYTNASLGLTVTQPLLQGFGLAVNNRNIRIAKNNLKVNDLVFKQQIIATVSQVISGYWDLVSFTENVKVKEQALAVSQKLYEDNKKQVEIGTLAPIEVVSAEAEVASNQQQLVNAQTQLLQQEISLKNALSKTGIASPTIADAHIIPTDHISVPGIEPVVPVQDMIAKALENRPEIGQSHLNIESSEIALKGDRSEMLPTLNLVGALSNSALAGVLNPLASADFLATANPFYIGGFNSTFSQIFTRKFPNYSLGFQLNVPIRNRSAQADYILDALSVRTQELQHQRLVNGIRVDVRNALIGVQQAVASYQAAVKARVLQEQKLAAEQKKYALGASTIYVVIQYQRDLAAAQSAEVTASSSYAKSKVQLDQVTGEVLNRYNISLAEAVKGRMSRAPSALPAVTQ